MANLYNVPLKNAVQHTLAATLTLAETSTITLDSSVASELQASATMKGLLVVDRVDVNGNLSPTKTEYIAFTGVSGSTVTGLTRGLGGTTAQGHSIGAIVEFVPDVTWAQAINDVFTTQHNDDGTHKNLAGSSLASLNLLNSNIDIFSFNTNNTVLASNVSGAVNKVTFVNSLVSTSPSLYATGTDTNINFGIYGKGTGYVYPKIKSERISSTFNSNATGIAVDVTGATVTFTPPFNAKAIVNTNFDFELGTANDLAAGQLNVNGVDESPICTFKSNFIGARSTVNQNYAVSLASGISYTLKLRMIRASGSGIVTAYSTHTGFTYFLIAS